VFPRNGLASTIAILAINVEGQGSDEESKPGTRKKEGTAAQVLRSRNKHKSIMIYSLRPVFFVVLATGARPLIIVVH
jgi:hypothetical protein